MGVLFDYTPLESSSNSGVHKNWHWHTDGCVFTQSDSDAFAIRKTKPQTALGEHLLFVHRYVEGHIRGRIGDLNIDRGPGTVNIIDLASRVECVQSPAVMQTMFIHKTTLGYDPDVHPPLSKFAIDHSVGRLLNALLADVFRDLLQHDVVNLAKLEQLKACLKMGMGTDPRRGDIRRHVRDALRDLICAHIERNLENWGLSVGSLLKEFGVSRASLYRMFEDRGGVRQFISNRRLLNAVLDISNGPILRGDIAAAAEKWGFTTGANFNRAVRREFGVAPGSLVNIADQEGQRQDSRIEVFDYHCPLQSSFGQLVQSKVLLPA